MARLFLSVNLGIVQCFFFKLFLLARNVIAIASTVKGNRDGAVVRALTSHQCGLGSIPGPGVIRGLSLLLVLYSAPCGFSPGTLVFPFLNNQHFQIPIRSRNAGAFQTSSCELLVLRG